MVSERKRFAGNKAKRENVQNGDVSKMLNKVARHLRFSIPTKKGILAGMKVDYFVGSAAVDSMLESPWAELKEHKNPKALFHTRADCIEYLQALIDQNMLHRSYKTYKPNQEGAEKRKFKLEVHEDQTFVDSEEDLYVWVYEPATLKQYVLGAILVIVVIVCCLFPLWPAKMRSLAVYASMGSAGLLGVLLALAVIKYVLFVVVWLATKGTVHFWFLPNLSEDCGFFESFVPVYEVKYPKEKKKKKGVAQERQEDENEPLLDGGDAVSARGDVEHAAKKEDEGFELLSASELDQNGT